MLGLRIQNEGGVGAAEESAAETGRGGNHISFSSSVTFDQKLRCYSFKPEALITTEMMGLITTEKTRNKLFWRDYNRWCFNEEH